MTRMHSLLRRQLVRFFGTVEDAPPELHPFVDAVNEAYDQSDTDRVMLERALDLSSKELLQANSDMRIIFQVLPDLFFRLDREGTILDFKGGNPTDFFRSPTLLIGKKIQDIPVPAVAQSFQQAIRQVGSSKSATSIEYWLRSGDEESYHEARLLPLQNSEIIVIIRDTTDRKRSEQHVESLNRLRETLLETESVGEKLKHITEAVVSTLKVDFARIWVLKPGDLCESGCFHAAVKVGPHVCKSRDRCLHLLASSGRYQHIDGQVHRRVPLGAYKIGRIASGEEPGFVSNDILNDPRLHDKKWAQELGLVAFAGFQILSAQGQVEGVLAFFSKRVISQQERAFGQTMATTAAQAIHLADADAQRHELKMKLERAKRMESLGILAGGIAHDLNNTLGPLVAYPELILMQLPDDSPARKHVAQIGRAAQEAADVIQDLLTLARRGRYEMKPLNLNDVVLEYLDSAAFTKKADDNPNTTLKLNLEENPSSISGSAPHLSKTIMNLINNAFDSMPDGGTITIASTQQYLDVLLSGYSEIESGEYILLRIRDEGCGIAESELSKIFEPYYSNKSMDSSGSGLGLSVVYGVVKDHSGYYDVISELDNGTEFILYFPVTHAVSKQGIQGKSSDCKGHETILVVDDVEAQKVLAVTLLSRLGYAVVAVSNGHEAVAYLKNCPKDIVVLDMIMEEGYDGLDTYRDILLSNPHQKAVIVTGFSATDRVQEMQDLGAGACVKKPYTSDTIGRAVREELDSSTRISMVQTIRQ